MKTVPDADDARPDELEASRETPGSSSLVRSSVEWVAIIGGALVLALVVRAFLLQQFYIPSSSMEPTLAVGDHVLVNKLSYDFHDVHRGDIVVFKRPGGASDPQVRDLIKRVVGLPGETIETRNGRLFVNDREVRETYVLPGSELSAPVPRQVIPDKQIFVMGDNRNNSRDSRVFGPIPESLVVGRAFVRVWPISEIRLM